LVGEQSPEDDGAGRFTARNSMEPGCFFSRLVSGVASSGVADYMFDKISLPRPFPVPYLSSCNYHLATFFKLGYNATAFFCPNYVLPG